MEKTETVLERSETLTRKTKSRNGVKNASKRVPLRNPEINIPPEFSKMTELNQKVLPKIFNDEVRPFLDAIDNLRNYGLDECLQLPTVIVIGDQSSGKSSILEAISGIQLPRGSGMVTRCPLQLQMKHNKHCGNWSAVLRFRDASNKPFEIAIKCPKEIEKLIIEAQNYLTNGENGISESLLTLSIEDPHVPNLTLIDLPGIARVSVGDQAHNLPEQILKLLRKYVSRKETMILTVCPCTADLATTEALKLAKEYDPDSIRTYGVLTKADLIDKGNENSVLKILKNELVPLKKGYTLVKCRGQQALQNKESLKQTLEKEKEFFTTHEVFRSLKKDEWGIGSLSQKLATDLINFIKRELPTIRSSISKKLTEAKQEELCLMCDYPTTSEAKLTFVLNKTNEFLKLFYDLTEGKYYMDDIEKIENKMSPNREKINIRLIPHARNTLHTFHNMLVHTAPEDSIDKAVEHLLETGQGKEPREFLSYDTFKKIALKFVKKTQPHIQTVMNNIYNNLHSVLNVLADYYFGKYPVFKADLLIIVFEILEKCKDKCERHLEMLLEKEKVFFTMDENYEEKIASLESLKSIKYALRKDWLTYFVDEEQYNPAVVAHGGLSYRTAATPRDKSGSSKKILPKYIIVYYLLTIRRISDNVSQTILYLLMTRFYEDLKSKLFAHVAHKDVYDLLDEDCVRIAEKKTEIEFKIQGFKQGIKEIDKLNFKHGKPRILNDKTEDEDDL